MKRPLFTFCLFVISVLVILTCCGVFSKEGNSALLPEHGSVITVIGTVCKTDSDKIYINHLHIFQSSEASSTLPDKFTFSISLDELVDTPPPRIGNSVKITGEFRQFSHATNPGEFDAYDYYAAINIYGSMRKTEISVTDNRIYPIKHFLYLIKNAGMSAIKSAYSPVDASIMNDLLFGDKSGLDPEIKELYQRVGISHILSISSLHISIIGLGIFSLLRRLRCPVKLSAIISASVLIMFGIMTGMSISAIRAIGIYIIGMMAKLLGRTTDTLTSLSLVAVIILLINPSQLTSCGFLLSFGSVTGICCLYPSLKKIASDYWHPKARYCPDTHLQKISGYLKKLLYALLNSLLAGISLTITTLPIQLYFFYEIPLFSTFLNLMVIPLMSILMICGYLSVFCPFLYIPGKICELILRFYKASAELFESFPHGQWNPGRPTPWLIILYYLLWLFVVMYPHIKQYIKNPLKIRLFKSIISIRDHIVCVTPVIFILLIIGFNSPTLPTNSVIFINVGQGDCILVYTDSKDVLIIDGGSSSRSSVGQYVIKSTLKYYGFSHISAIYISHPDNDHINGIVELLNNSQKWNLRIDNLYLAKYANSETLEINALQTNASQSNTSLISSGYTADYGSVHIDCLHPSVGFESPDTNEASMCLLLTFNNSHIYENPDYKTTLLLCGDISGCGEGLLNDAILPHSPITLLKVSHHGSRYSTTDAFLSAAAPSLAFISAGANNNYGHPHAETLQRLKEHGCTYYSTIDCGAITINIKPSCITIKKYIDLYNAN